MTTESSGKLTSRDYAERLERRAAEEVAELEAQLAELRQERKRDAIAAAVRDLQDEWRIEPQTAIDLLGDRLDLVRAQDGSWTLAVKDGNGSAFGSAAVSLLLSLRDDASAFKHPVGFNPAQENASDGHARVRPRHPRDVQYDKWIAEAEQRGGDTTMLLMKQAQERAERADLEQAAERAARPRVTQKDVEALRAVYAACEARGDALGMISAANRLSELAD